MIETVRLEGPIFVHDTLFSLFRGELDSAGGFRPDLPPGIRLNDEIGRSFVIATTAWRTLRARGANPAPKDLRRFLRTLFVDAFGHSETPVRPPDDLAFRLPVPVPVFFVPSPALSIDTRDRRYVSPEIPARSQTLSQFVQQWLNLRPDALWAVATDGRTLRLLRDNNSLSRPAYLEFDLARILDEGRQSDFSCLFRLLYRGCLGSAPDASGSLWEKLRAKGLEDGVRVFSSLRDGVVKALLHLGDGFLADPSVRAKFNDGRLTSDAFFQQLLRTAYRFLFLFSAEERGILHVPSSAGGTDPARIYAAGYSMRRLADRSRRAASRTAHTDLWDSVRIVFRALASGEPRLALPALGGLFRTDQAPDLDAAALSNRALLDAVRALRWTHAAGAEQRVDYRNLGSEELGSVYESLLELVPSVSIEYWRFSFVGIPDPRAPAAPARGRRSAAVAGNTRKTSGSYYTPASLVGQLVRSVIDPLLDKRLEGLSTPADREAALLSLSVLDPACGSGHFLLAAARRIAERLVQVRSDDEIPTPDAYRTALRDVVAHCIYGADLNPMAIELAKIALWIETLVPGQPLSFLDAHFAVGNSVLGVLRLDVLSKGIPDDAYAPLDGDDRAACSELKRRNRTAVRQHIADTSGGGQQLTIFDPGSQQATLSEQFARIDAMPEGTLEQIEAKRAAHETFLTSTASAPLASASDLYTAAFLLPKTAPVAPAPEPTLFPTESPSQSGTGGAVPPTSSDLYATLGIPGFPLPSSDTLAASAQAASSARVLHWPLVFPAVFAKGGFDAIIGNPPWDQIQFAPREWFATRDPEVANARNMAERELKIAHLAQTNPKLFALCQKEGHEIGALQSFIHGSGRFPTSSFGRLNLAPVFLETSLQLLHPNGRAGLVLPSGIASDSFTQALFRSLVDSNRLESLHDFENTNGIFPDVHRMFKFCLMTFGHAPAADFTFFLHSLSELSDSRRHFTLASSDFALLNPNTRTCPVFRTSRDAELAKSIYRRVPPLLLEDPSESGPGSTVCPPNPWHIRFQLMFMMNTGSRIFQVAPGPNLLPLYEGKMIGQFDHRYNAFDNPGQENFHACTPEEKADPAFDPAPRYWVPTDAVISASNQNPPGHPPSVPSYLFGFRDVCRAVDVRTTIASVIPFAAVGNKLPLFFTPEAPPLQACLLADFNSLVHDWLARQKVGGISMSFFILKQLPTLPPSAYTPEDIAYIVPRILELTYTSHSLVPWARALGHDGAPFPWDEDRRAILRAELDARYARLYGLTRDDLLYILDPKAATNDPTFPSESFRVLRDSELSTFGEYRTARLVMSAWREQELAGIDTYVRQAAPFEEADTRKDYLKFLVRQMLRDTYSETLSVSDLYSVWAALSDPDRMAANKDMPGMTKAWAAQFKDAIRDSDNLEDILVGMCADRQISISRNGMVSLRQFPLDESLSEVRDISMDASLALLYSRKMRAAGESVRCKLSVEFVKRMEDGDFEYGIAA